MSSRLYPALLVSFLAPGAAPLMAQPGEEAIETTIEEAVQEVVESPARETGEKSKEGRADKPSELERPATAPPSIPAPPPPLPIDEVKPAYPLPTKPGDKPRKKFNPPNDVLVSKDGKSLHLVGDISSGLSRKLKRLIEENPDAETIVLSSNGGLVIEGLALARIAEKAGLNTHVETVCASACTLVFLKGKERSMTANAVLGFHQASRSSFFPRYNDDGDNAGNKVMVNSYRAGGASEYIIENALDTPPSKMWLVNGKDMARNLPDMNLVKAGTVKYPKGIWWSADDLLDKLYDDPIWKLAAKKRPNYFYSAFAEIWNSGILGRDLEEAMGKGHIELRKRLLQDAAGYPDDIVIAMIELESDFWAQSEGDWNKNCFSVGIRRVPFIDIVEEAMKAREDALLRQIFDLPETHELPDKDAMDTAAAKVLEFWGVIIAETDLSSYDVKRKLCREPKLYFEKLRELPPKQQADIYRALLTPEYRYRRGY